MRAAADQAGRLVLVAENYAYRPTTVPVRDFFAEGAVGDVLLVAVNALKHQQPSGWRADPAQIGGGPLLEGGVHWLSLLASLGLTVRDVSARPIPAGGEDSLVVMLGYAGARPACWRSPGVRTRRCGGANLARVWHGGRHLL